MKTLGDWYSVPHWERKQNLPKALHWYNEAAQKGLDVKSDIYRVTKELASNYLAKGKTDEAMELYRELEEDGHVVASDIHEIKMQIASKHADNEEYSEAIGNNPIENLIKP